MRQWKDWLTPGSTICAKFLKRYWFKDIKTDISMCQIKDKNIHTKMKFCLESTAYAIYMYLKMYNRWQYIYTIQISLLQNAYFASLWPKGTQSHRHPPTDIYPPIAGSKYPIQVYKLLNEYSLNPSTKGADTPSNWNISSNWWQYISKTNVYLTKCIFSSATDNIPQLLAVYPI